MTDNEINIEIFKTQGGKLCPIHLSYGCCGKIFPDYCHDLNAMHEVETVLPEPEYRMFYYQLHKLRNDDCLPICKCISAPARQRAEAYLRVKGLWQQSTSAATKGM